MVVVARDYARGTLDRHTMLLKLRQQRGQTHAATVCTGANMPLTCKLTDECPLINVYLVSPCVSLSTDIISTHLIIHFTSLAFKSGGF